MKPGKNAFNRRKATELVVFSHTLKKSRPVQETMVYGINVLDLLIAGVRMHEWVRFHVIDPYIFWEI